MPTVAKRELHLKFATALGLSTDDHSAFDGIPFQVRLANGVELSIFAFTLTQSKSATNRPTGEYKAQLIVPGQQRGAGRRARLPIPGDAVPIIAAWSPEHEVFVFWDGYAHVEFAFSKNMQVRELALSLAQVHGIHEVQRSLPPQNGRDRGVETIIIARQDCLQEAISKRIKLSADREASLEQLS